ncbi:MAG: signal peptidase I [Verrucomicrobiota bacterium]
MTWRWLFSRTLRQANDLCHRVEKILNSQRDVLAPQAITAVRSSIQDLRSAAGQADASALESRATDLESVANKWLKPYPYANVRENVDVILVALVIALGIRTFFLQPMAIPTGSMQPTLYGITQQNLREDPHARVPNGPTRVFNALARGIWYYHVTAIDDGDFKRFEPPERVLRFFKRQQFVVGDHTYTVWFPPDEFERRSQLLPGQRFRKGQDILNLKVMSGDRLFVDRFSYNFRRPSRGDIVIFASHGLPDLTPDTHYIKRLIGLPGERVRILNNRHVAINDHELDASTPHFENIYTFSGPPREDHYSGHLNSFVAQQFGRPMATALFPDETAVYTVPPHQYFVCGDNTMNSYDSRYWGSFPDDRVVGRFSFCFWPISARFGWAVR